MKLGQLRLLIRWMAIEEWRLHSSLFGGVRFAGFPLTLAVLTGVAAFSLAHIGLEFALVTAGVIILAGCFGLQTGSVGFDASDAIENLLGDVTLLIYSSRTLPLSGRAVFLAFIIKDLGYYAGLFLLPITVGVVSGMAIEAMLFPSDVIVACLNCAGIETFSTGYLAFVALKTWLMAAGAFAVGLVVGLVFSGVSIAVRGVGQSHADETESRLGSYTRLTGIFGGSRTAAIAAKTVLDVQRSSGGILKLGLSSATLLGASYVILELVSQHVPIAPSYGVLFGALLSVTAFPTYTWVTRTDDPSDYRLYPISGDCLVQAKALAFAALEAPVVIIYYAVVLVTLGPSLSDIVAGTVVLVGLLVYVFAVTVALTGFKPSEFLFDTVVFTKYSALVMGALLPPLVLGLFVSVSGVILPLLTTYGLGVGCIGWLIFRRVRGRAESELSPTAR